MVFLQISFIFFFIMIILFSYLRWWRWWWCWWWWHMASRMIRELESIYVIIYVDAWWYDAICHDTYVLYVMMASMMIRAWECMHVHVFVYDDDESLRIHESSMVVMTRAWEHTIWSMMMMMMIRTWENTHVSSSMMNDDDQRLKIHIWWWWWWWWYVLDTIDQIRVCRDDAPFMYICLVSII